MGKKFFTYKKLFVSAFAKATSSNLPYLFKSTRPEELDVKKLTTT